TGDAGNGGGARCTQAGACLFRSCVIANNSAKFVGGGLQVGYGGTAQLVDCEVTNNTVGPLAYLTVAGGGLEAGYANLELFNCKVTNNRAYKSALGDAVGQGIATYSTA